MKWEKRNPDIEFDRQESVINTLADIRGISLIDDFLNPQEDALNDPYSLKNIEIVRNVILNAIHNGLNIAIFGDIDGDGITSTSLLFNYLRNFTDNVSYFHSQRSKGHGIEQGIDLIPPETKLLIIVDSSTSSADTCKEIQEMGIEVLIVDHHPPDRENPYAIIVNPQLDDYPNKEISAAGLVWKLCQVIDDTMGTDYHNHLIDLAGIGVYGDQMSMLVPENRYIVSEALNNIKNFGIHALLQVNDKDVYNLTTTDLGFSIVPMINGSARLDRIELVFELLTSDDYERCVELAKEIKKLNNQRKKMQTNYLSDFQSQINLDDKIIIIIDDNIGKGFTGLIAGQIAQTYQRPALVLSREKNNYNGSYRSVNGFNVKAFFESITYLNFIGGHNAAGGLGVKAIYLEDFKQDINKRLKDVEFDQALQYDLDIDVNDIDAKLIKEIQVFNRLSGKDIPPAKFLIKGLFVTDKATMGKAKEHVKILCDGLDIVKFKVDEDYYSQIPTFTEIEAIGTLNLNKWMNWKEKKEIVTKQLLMDDYRIID